jgi:predicted nuclease of restriction endonuclease-like (RecB) superfamily
MAKQKKQEAGALLLNDVARLIEESRQALAVAVNAGLTYLYWQIGDRINSEVLNYRRAAYGRQIVVSLARQLAEAYGRGYEEKNIRRMMQFAAAFPEREIVVSMIRQLSWTHIIALLPLKDALQREFYAELCRTERWSVRTLRDKIDGMLYERTAVSRKPGRLARQELKALRDTDMVTPDLVFRDPYILDFLGLKGMYGEKDLEQAILNELERFILELGEGFTFAERQKRMIIDGEDFRLDLLFYHRKLKCLVAIELKLGKFKPAYKAQMELYLRWLERHEKEEDERPPIGLILCAEGNREQIELLQLPGADIKIAEYLTELPTKKVLQQKLHRAIAISKQQMEKKAPSPAGLPLSAPAAAGKSRMKNKPK